MAVSPITTTSSNKQLSQVCWKDTNQLSRHKQPEYIVSVNSTLYHHWLHSPSPAIPLADVVDSFDIFVSQNGNGNTGYLDRPSQQQLFDAFGVKERGGCIERILREGVEKPMHHGNELMPNDRRATKQYGRW
jgi:hypothetical protein